ncbi:MAG TPA: transcriptional regulator [Nitrosomonas nitrosa]|uniref:sigma-E factor negative regulatory protein n=1 Tax=Nitrosomonas nitrosa TaxID=52442 RepID=UPI000D307BEA|nr:sigma-E factor negative regulatory protein [Nitrosomonas nitrosa]PTR03496.1 sigma-E factor negative regulatory protein RseA [Nitrosomonas nitrosa]HBZ29707.1 transcriptional regulator [Nitrosomonas nitrosa]HNP50408.1 sigma-E factor negative regulatory protein [Nitrosomonas nitrosa]
MKNKISELMDGELDTVNAEEIILALKKQEDLLREWETYHVISDMLRQPAVSMQVDVARRVSERLAEEPILFMPSMFKLYKRKIVTLSAAASFVILASGWLVMQASEMKREVLVAEKVNNKAVIQVDHPLTFQPTPAFTLPLIPQHSGDYPLIHRGFSSHTIMHTPVTGVYQVEDQHE